MKPKLIGSVNATHTAYIYNSAGNVIATTIDTPNAIAYAFGVLPNAVRAVSYPQYFPEEVTERKDVDGRIKYTTAEIHGKYLKIM